MSNFPSAFDTPDNLYDVKDALWALLAVDYYPKQGIIIADRDISAFPPTGIITLVDQCSPPHERATSFKYNKRTNKEFLGLKVMSERDSFKPKKLTKITMQVMSDHRESLKDSIIAIEKFLGPKHLTDINPHGKTIFGRINFLRKILFSPKAWFEANVVKGVTPLTVNFKYTGTGNVGAVGEVTYTWKFGEDELETKDSTVEKTFLTPGLFDASVTIKNSYGEDAVKFVNMINVKGAPPEEAIVSFAPHSFQLTAGIKKIRTPINYPVNVEVPQGLMQDNTKTMAGESVDPATKQKIDKITKYTWNLGDILPHANLPTTKALYTIGGLYDIVLKTETEMGSYRVTTIPDAIDVVETTNLWLWSVQDKQVRSHEFGLISEVFKTSETTYDLEIDDSFVENDRQKFEFWRNNGAAKKGELPSGSDGSCILFWASGRRPDDSTGKEKVNAVEYNGFSGTYIAMKPLAVRPWNWASFVSDKNIYFFLGNTPEGPHPTLSPTNQTKTIYNISAGVTSSNGIAYTKYLNGATDLMYHPDVFTKEYNAPNGHFSAYRTCWSGNVGYLMKNGSLGEYFNFQDFYKTSGVLSNPFQNIVKLPDLPGDGHKEGDLVALEHGVYFFDNLGGTYFFNQAGMTWETVVPHNKIAKDHLSKLLAVSDGGRAYISIDDDIFFKFNEADMSYVTLHGKPYCKQWLMKIF